MEFQFICCVVFMHWCSHQVENCIFICKYMYSILTVGCISTYLLHTKRTHTCFECWQYNWYEKKPRLTIDRELLLIMHKKAHVLFNRHNIKCTFFLLLFILSHSLHFTSLLQIDYRKFSAFWKNKKKII